MNKLEHDNLYKFLVSIGITLTILPIAIYTKKTQTGYKSNVMLKTYFKNNALYNFL